MLDVSKLKIGSVFTSRNCYVDGTQYRVIAIDEKEKMVEFEVVGQEHIKYKRPFDRVEDWGEVI